MIKFLSQILIVLGSLFVGFGIGILIPQIIEIPESKQIALAMVSLVFGGFLIGFGILRKPAKKEMKEVLPEEKPEEK